MHDTLVWCLLKGTTQGEPWVGQNVKFICPVPGYDRHFALCEQYGIEMIPVPLGEHGPDLDAVRELAADPSVKGIWVVPTYANPTGAIYDESVTRELLSMPAAPDFRIFWDNAYAVHHLTDVVTPALDVLGMAAEAGNPDRVFVFASTSKITFAGAGVSFFGGSPATIAWYQRHLAKRSIGPDKVNHLRHVRYLQDAGGVRTLMAEHAALIAPKFAQVDAILTERLGPYRTASWTAPDRRLLHQPGRARRHRLPGGGAGQGGRDRDDRRGGGLSVRQGPARPEHPDRPDLPVARRRGGCDRRTGNLRPAGGGRAGAGRAAGPDRLT